MSCFSQGIGWWQASDGKWYPPDQVPPGVDAPEPRPPRLRPEGDLPGPNEGGSPWGLPASSEARPIPELTTSENEHSHRWRLTDPVVLLVGALLLVTIGAGSAAAISYATSSSPARSAATTTPPPTNGPATSPSTNSDPSANSSAVPPTTSTTSPVGTQSPSGSGPSTVTGPPGDPVNQTAANTVLTTTWAGYSQAMIANDRPAVSQYTTPSAYETSIGLLNCGCLPAMS
jgi:hypothetical protein